MEDKNQTTLTIDARIAYLDVLQIAIANILVDQLDQRRAENTNWSVLHAPTQSEVRNWVRGELRQLGKTAGVRAQLTQMGVMHEIEMLPQDYQVVRNAAQRVVERAFDWKGPVQERWVARTRVSITLDRDQVVRLLAARVLGWMTQSRDRDRNPDWWRVNWWRGLNKGMVRWYIRHDLAEYGLDSITKADHQYKLCSDSMLSGTMDVPNHVTQMCKWRAERTFRMGAYAP